MRAQQVGVEMRRGLIHDQAGGQMPVGVKGVEQADTTAGVPQQVLHPAVQRAHGRRQGRTPQEFAPQAAMRGREFLPGLQPQRSPRPFQRRTQPRRYGSLRRQHIVAVRFRRMPAQRGRQARRHEMEDASPGAAFRLAKSGLERRWGSPARQRVPDADEPFPRMEEQIVAHLQRRAARGNRHEGQGMFRDARRKIGGGQERRCIRRARCLLRSIKNRRRDGG